MDRIWNVFAAKSINVTTKIGFIFCTGQSDQKKIVGEQEKRSVDVERDEREGESLRGGNSLGLATAGLKGSGSRLSSS